MEEEMLNTEKKTEEEPAIPPKSITAAPCVDNSIFSIQLTMMIFFFLIVAFPILSIREENDGLAILSNWFNFVNT
jgi:hypothetical protein